MSIRPEAVPHVLGPAVYVASPLGFSDPGARYLEEVLHPALIVAGFSILDPWATGRELVEKAGVGADLATLNSALGAANAELINRSTAIFAVLDGTDVDSGTASEIGFASALGRPVEALRTDFRMAGDNPAAPVNLQVLHFIHGTGGSLHTTLEEAVVALRNRVAPDVTSRIFHLADRSKWSSAKRVGAYDASTRDQALAEVGFIHCSFDTQLLKTAGRFYADADETQLVVLVIDPERLTAPLSVEQAGNGEGFPHIYGPLNVDAVVATISLERDGEGFRLGAATRS
jgi:uncharacterized protein (DUF952 family)/nucleoside 2-deoxyribosyltransferase